MTQFEREEEQLYKDLAAGLITQKQLNEEMREMERSMAAEQRERAQDAYDEVMGRDW